MQVLDFITLLIILAAFFTLINVKYLKLPSTIGLMILALGLSVFIVFGEIVFSTLRELSTDMMKKFKFTDVLFQVMLSFLLFAGALEMNLKKLGEEKWPILVLATAGTLISTFLVGTAVFYLLPIVGIEITYINCLLFGALISPTDPIAVLAMIKKTPVSKNLESQIAGESLFNDGVGVVVFLSILAIAGADPGVAVEPLYVVKLFAVEVLGGLLLGAAIGYVGLYLLKIIDNEHTEIEVLVTLSMVLGGASIAKYIGVSGPLAMVVMGLWVSRVGRDDEDAAGDYVYKFWHLMDEAMNAILFILIGLQIIRIYDELENVGLILLFAIPLAIAVVLLSRLIGVGIPVQTMRIFRKFPPYTIRILTWSGLRGGISVALALSLYEANEHTGFQVSAYDANVITAMTYGVVLFSIVIQGLTVKKLFNLYNKANSVGGSSKPKAKITE